jgi:hypothetical protein
MTPVCKFATGVNYAGGKFEILPPVPLVLLIPVANLPPVSTTPVAKKWEQYQTADTLK